MIEVNNLSTYRINENFLKNIAGKSLKREKKKIDLSIALVGQMKIRELNRKYRKKDKATDVLSFQYGEAGEIVICPEEVKKNAEKYQSTFKKELARVLTHGVLHILGYSHRAMEKLR